MGVASQTVKTLVARRMRAEKPCNPMEYVDKLAEELRDVELRHQWEQPTIFTKTFMKTGASRVELSLKDINNFLGKLKSCGVLGLKDSFSSS